MSTTLTPAEQHFYEHAGYSYDPETVEQGRARGARALAQAEAWAKAEGLAYGWEDDWGINHVAEFDCYDTDPETCEYVELRDPDGNVLNSLSCIDDATPEYRRVVEAELALDVMATWGTWSTVARQHPILCDVCAKCASDAITYGRAMGTNAATFAVETPDGVAHNATVKRVTA